LMVETSGAAPAWRIMRALVLDNERRREVCDALGMSFIRIKALLRLADGPLAMGELASSLATDAPYMTLVVDDLEQRGLVERQAHPHDRRAKVVVATDRGRAEGRRARAILETPPAAFADLSPDDLEALVRILSVFGPLQAPGDASPPGPGGRDPVSSSSFAGRPAATAARAKGM
jgi:DNA-binding MarR family transcriptional regulator